jgi:TonB-dependent starch-binding outer membrane protein SusC
MKCKQLLKRTFLLLFLSILITGINAQTRNIIGKVTDENHEPLPGVSIVIKGVSATGTITNADGDYSIAVAPDVKSLEYSFVGMLTENVEIGNQEVINVVLLPDLLSLDEVVVIGYGTQKKSDLISSVVTVKPESMTKVPSTDVGEMLRGKAPGVFVTVDNAGPGSSSKILIRGKNSITGGNDPIVIADGVPVNNINEINPNDIASLEVLKDAAAQAIYGARASNGVILITTKRAQTGQTKVSYNGYYGMQTVQRHFDVYSPEEFAQLKREADRTDNNNVYRADELIFTPLELESIQSGEYIDWEKEVLQIAPMQNHNLSVSSGNESTKVFSSFNYINQEGVVPGTDYEKLTVRLNIDQKVTNWLALGLNSTWQKSTTNYPGTQNTLKSTITTSPLGKIYEDDGVTLRLHPTGVQESFNPLLDIAETTGLREDINNIVNAFIDITPFTGFKYRVNASRRAWDQKASSYSTGESLIGIQNGGLGQGQIIFQDNIEWQLENIFTYDMNINVHNLGLTFVQSISEKTTSKFRNTVSDVPNDLLGIYGLEAALSNTPEIDAIRRGLVSYVLRAQYDYNGKYYLTLSARADGSTVFGKNNKWGYFPAAAIGWNLYRESFLQNMSVISNLKLRASYGSVGNEGINPYGSQSTAGQYDYIFDGTKALGYSPGAEISNPNLKWETSTTLNTALDFGFWRNRLYGTFEYYKTNTRNLLVYRKLSAGTGYSRILSNIGEVENQGIELNINGVIVSKKDLTVNAGLSFSKNNNKIIHLYETDEDGDGIEDNDIANSWFIGEPIDVYYQYKPIGIFQEGEDIVNNTHQPTAQPGDVKLWDRDPDDGALNGDDRVITKKDPDWYGSFNLGINYKNFDFSADVLFVQGVIKRNEFLYSYTEGGSLRGVFNGVKQDYWTPENPTGNWPRPRVGNDPTNIYSMGLQNASYTRLQNITIGYSFSENLLSKIKLSNLRIYLTGHNLVTITKFQSYSPEKNAYEYPEAVSVVGGLQVSF